MPLGRVLSFGDFGIEADQVQALLDAAADG